MKKYIFCSLFVVQSVTAQEVPKVPKAPDSNQYSLKYGSNTWNKSSKNIDSAFMFLKDKKTGKIAKISIEETAPDSSTFEGQFSIRWSDDKVDPEIYIPPENLRNDPRAVEKFNTLLNNNQLKAQPLLSRKEKNITVFDVYDTETQAKKAQKVYQNEQTEIKKAANTNLLESKANETSIETSKLAAREAMLSQLALETAKRERERLRLEQIEAQKLDEMRKKQAKMAEQEKLINKKKALELSKQAVAAYQQGRFETAEPLFGQAVELDPENKEHLFMYGISQFRVNKFNDALVTLRLANTTGDADLEKNYYMGLIHFKLQEIPLARDKFTYVRKSEHPVLSASAAFYEGLLYFSEENFEPSKKAFEFVLDKSSDAALDKKAEEYIEKILQLQQQKKIAAQKWNGNIKGGITYDSNILNSPTNDDSTGSPTNDGGLRLLLLSDVDYKFYYTPKDEIHLKASTTYYYSFDSEFASADPWVVAGNVPWTRKGMWDKRGFTFSLSPGYETIFMDYDSTGSRTNILNTLLVNADLQLIMSDKWFSGYSIDLRNDDSLIVDSADDNADALKMTIKKSEIFFLDHLKKRAFMASLAYVLNDADGKNKIFNRIDLNFNFFSPFNDWANAMWFAGVTAYKLDYPDGDDGRNDTNINFSGGIQKVVSEKWNWTVTASIGDNSSNIDDYTYDKYTILGMWGYSWGK